MAEYFSVAELERHIDLLFEIARRNYAHHLD